MEDGGVSLDTGPFTQQAGARVLIKEVVAGQVKMPVEQISQLFTCLTTNHGGLNDQ